MIFIVNPNVPLGIQRIVYLVVIIIVVICWFSI